MQIRPITACVSFLLLVAGHSGSSSSRAGRSESPDFSPPIPESLVLTRRGYQEYRSGNLRSAVSSYDQAAGAALRARDWQSAAVALQNGGGVRQMLLEYRAALDRYVQARECALKSSDIELQSMIGSNICSLYMQLGEFDLAEAEAERVIRKRGPGISAATRAGLLANTASIRARKGRLPEALPMFYEAINTADQQEDNLLRASIWWHLGEAQRLARRPADADEAFTEAYRLRLMNHARELPISHAKLGQVRLEQGDPLAAERLLTLAVNASAGLSSRSPVWWALYYRGLARRALARPWAALEDFRTARDEIRRWRLEVPPADAVRVSADVGLHEVYAAYVGTAADLYLQTRRRDLLEESFLAAELNRAASLRESIAEGSRRLPGEYWETLARLRASRGGADSPQAAGWRLRLVELEAQAGLHLFQNPRESTVPLLAGVQQRLGPDDCLITFDVREEGSYSWAVTRASCSLRKLPAKSSIAAAASGFADQLRTGGPEATATAERLGQLLFSGLSPEARAKRNWKLVLDDSLFGIPFAALVTKRDHGRPRYLVEEREIEILPGALTVAAGKTLAGGLFAGFGDSVYNRADERLEAGRRPSWFGALQAAPSKSTGHELNRLIGSGSEVQSCARVWQSSAAPAVVALGQDVCRASLLRALERRPAVLHLATHVVPSPGEPGDLSIALGLGSDGKMDLLAAREIRVLQTGVGVVVLSGCSSGSGPVRPGVGLLGLTRAWLMAGARSVVASYWPVADDDGDLFRRFYVALGRPPTAVSRTGPAAALRKAQLDLLGKGIPPRYWAAHFVVSQGIRRDHGLTERELPF